VLATNAVVSSAASTAGNGAVIPLTIPIVPGTPTTAV
jgi:hypothetical protein